MIGFYDKKSKGKSAAAKKYKTLLQKIKNIPGERIDMVLDEYFWKVCYEYYKREMRIWVLLSHKYLKSAKISNRDRKWII